MPRLVGYPAKLTKRPVRKYVEAVAEARQKLVYGQEYRRVKREPIWKRSEAQYEGDHWSFQNVDDDNADLIVINMSFSTVNVLLPYMTGSEPRFLVTPYSGDATVRNAKIQEALLNRLWRSRQVAGKRHLSAAAWDYLVYGDGYVKVGYSINQKRVGDTDYADIAELWVERVSPWDIWIDPMSDGIHNARWVAQRLRMTRAELEESGAYFNLQDDNVAYGVDQVYESEVSTRTEQEHREVFDGSEFAVVYEFYDLVHNRMIAFSDGELPIRWVDDIGGCPIVQLANYRIPNSPYHMGEMEQIWEIQLELNKTRSHLITHRRRNAAKILARRGVLNQEAIDALQSQVVNAVVFVDGDGPLDNLVAPVELPNLSADVYNVSELMQRDIYEITGVNEYLRGASPEIRKTATEASIIEGASNVKSQYKLSQIETAVAEVGWLMLATARDVYPQTDYDELQLFLTGREADAVARSDLSERLLAARQAGDTAAMAEIMANLRQPMDVQVSPSPDIFQGEYEVEVESRSTELRNPVLRENKYREMALMMIQMAPMLMQLGVVVNYKRLLEQWLEAANVDDVEGIVEGSPPVAAQPAAGGDIAGAAPQPGQPPPIAQDPSTMGFLDSQNTGQFPVGVLGEGFPAA